jgi:hypothetical protein
MRGKYPEPSFSLEQLQAANVEAVAVCLLFSFTNPDHERGVAVAARAAGFYVSASSEILPDFREYERTSTVVLNAYVGPLIERYLLRLEESLPRHTLPAHHAVEWQLNLKRDGTARGGDGLVREITFEVPTEVTLLTERRVTTPYGLQGGEPGTRGENRLQHGDHEILLPGKVHFQASPGDRLTVLTPGGGWGEAPAS